MSNGIYITVTGLAFMIALLLLDAGFNNAVAALMILLRGQSDLGMKLTTRELLKGHGVRTPIIVVALLLIIAGIITSTTATMQSMTLDSLLLLTAITAVSATILFYCETLAWYGFLLRLRIRAPQLSRTCSAILQQWPDVADAISTLGSKIMATGHDCIATEDIDRPLFATDHFGSLIYRSESSVIMDSMTYHDWAVIYCEETTLPTIFHIKCDWLEMQYIPEITIQLIPRLFLVKIDVFSPALDEVASSIAQST